MSTCSTSSRQKRLKTPSFLHLWLRNVLRATTACTFSTSEPPKVVRDRQFLTLLTWKCASRHNGVHFFDISTSKSGPRPSVFNTFDLEMRFAPQRRALFWHLNFQKWSDADVFCTFWLGNVLRATTACTFSTSQLPKVVREWCVLCILTWKCASRHNGVQFFISHLASWLRTRRFSEPTFRPSGATNHWKNAVNRDFPTFSRICIFFLLTLSLLLFSLLIFLFSLHLPCSAFHLSILSEVWLLNFLRSGFGKPPSLCVNPGYLSKPYKNFGFGYVGYLVCLFVYLSVYVSTHLFLYLSWCLTICLCVHVSICLSRRLCL